MASLQHFLAASALLFAAVPVRGDSVPERAVVLQLCIAENAPEHVEAMLTKPVEKSLIGVPRVTRMNSITGHGGARFEIHVDGGASEQDAASVAQALDRSEAGRGAAILSRSVQLGEPLPGRQAFGHAVCAAARRR